MLDGIKYNYPRITARFGKLALIFQVIRPLTLVAPFIAGLLGVLAFATQITYSEIVMACNVGFVLAFIQAGGQAYNQYADYRVDRLNKPYRPIPRGYLTREEVKGLAYIFFGIGLIRAVLISWQMGVFASILFIFAMGYSVEYGPRKRNAWLNLTWVSLSRGFVPLIMVASLYGTFTQALPYALLAFLWMFAFQSSKDVQDMHGDKAFQIKTIATQYGADGVRYLMMGGFVVFVTTTLMLQEYFFLSLCPFAFAAILNTNKTTRRIENNWAWVYMYTGLAFFYVNLVFSRWF